MLKAEAGLIGPDPGEKAALEDTIRRYQGLDPVRDVVIGGKTVRFATPNEMTLDRVWNLFDAEPVTIQWILGFSEGESLVDIGANVGTYGIMAAVLRDARVFAFEPESQNFALLSKNIIYNDLAGRMTAWPLAISDELQFDHLHLWGFRGGNSHHFFGQKLNHRLEPQEYPYVQGAVSAGLDQLVAAGALPIPNHIKIDVDGLEDKVVAGATGVLAEPEVKSVLIEINTNLEPHLAIRDRMRALGFAFDPDQVAQSTRTDDRHAGIAEHLFSRPG